MHIPQREPDEPLITAPPRVLIADPDAFLVDDYRDYLVAEGFEVETAASGLECLQRLREFSPDVLVLEPAIPWGGGDGVVALMYEDSSIARVPVIVLTYGCDRRTLYNLALLPIDDYQRKPLAPNRLAERIQRVIGLVHQEPAGRHAKPREKEATF